MRSINFDFYQVKEDIEEQIKQFWIDYDKDGDIEEVIEEFKHYYGNDDNSVYYYDIGDAWDWLNDSYREGSVWVIERLTDDYGFDAEYTMDILKKMSKDNQYYLQQLIYLMVNDFDYEKDYDEIDIDDL